MRTSEPPAAPVRHRGVRVIPAVGVLLLVVVGLGACGDEPTAGEAPSECTSSDGAVLVELDLDGDGTRDQVRATTDPSCPGTVVARTGAGPVVGDLALQQLKGQPRVLTLPGRDAQLLALREEHPRGGFQVRVYGARGSQLVEYAEDGAPLVPFVATDVTGFGVSTACGHRSTLRVRVAEASGTGATVDVIEHRYRFDDAGFESGHPVRLATGITEAQLRQRFPGVAGNAMYENC